MTSVSRTSHPYRIPLSTMGKSGDRLVCLEREQLPPRSWLSITLHWNCLAAKGNFSWSYPATQNHIFAHHGIPLEVISDNGPCHSLLLGILPSLQRHTTLSIPPAVPDIPKAMGKQRELAVRNISTSCYSWKCTLWCQFLRMWIVD